MLFDPTGGPNELEVGHTKRRHLGDARNRCGLRRRCATHSFHHSRNFAIASPDSLTNSHAYSFNFANPDSLTNPHAHTFTFASTDSLANPRVHTFAFASTDSQP